jgi:sugar lactone lactonase YvrE
LPGKVVLASVTAMKAEPLHPCRCVLGEGPVWWQERIWWVDIEDRRLFSLVPGTSQPASWEFPERIGFAVPSQREGTWIVGLENGFHAFHPRTGQRVLLHEVEAHRPENRCNDGKCDPNGCLWAGTLHRKGNRNEAALYRIAKGESRRVLDGISVSNGLAWDPARGT